VSTIESGFYKCISKGLVDDSQFKVHSVELIVKNDWKELWETDFEVTFFLIYIKIIIILY